MHSQKFLRQRKFAMVLPLIVIFFVTIVFVALGGGKSKSTDTKPIEGLNLKLPDAHFKKEKEKNKLNLYEQASRDSFKIKQSVREDPLAFRMEDHQELENIFKNTSKKYFDSNEEKVIRKLALLKSKLNERPPEIIPQKKEPDYGHLENMMAAINAKNETSPEIKELSSIMDKILAAEHPEKLQDSIQKMKPVALPVTMTNDSVEQNGFYGLSDDMPADKHNAIEAVIDEEQTLVSGDQISNCYRTYMSMG